MPWPSRRRWGDRSRHQRPVRSSTSNALGGNGISARSAPRSYAVVALLVTDADGEHTVRASSRATRRLSPDGASALRRRPGTGRPPLGPAGRRSPRRQRGTVSAPARCPARPGVPDQPSASAGSTRQRPGSSRRCAAPAGSARHQRRRGRDPRARRGQRPSAAPAAAAGPTTSSSERAARRPQADARACTHPLFAPRVRPDTNCFCSTKKTISVGMAASTEPAESRL